MSDPSRHRQLQSRGGRGHASRTRRRVRIVREALRIPGHLRPSSPPLDFLPPELSTTATRGFP
jgi:hypothetical protein